MAVVKTLSKASDEKHKAFIVTGDPEFKKVENLAEIFWI